MAECDLHALVKSPSNTMQEHINKFEHLIANVNFNRPAEIPPMRKAEINLIFLRSLERQDADEGMRWLTYHTSLGDRAYTMETSQLEAEVKALASTTLNSNNHLQLAPPVQALTASASPLLKSKTKKGKKGKNQFHPYKRKDNSSDSINFRFDKTKFCSYCKCHGHSIHDCLKKKYMDIQFPRNDKYRNQTKSNGGNNYNSGGRQRYRSYPSNDLNDRISEHSSNDQRRYDEEEYRPRWHAKVTKFIAHSSTHIPIANADPNDWIIDSACNVHLTPFKDRITHYKEFAQPQQVAGLGGKICTAIGMGNLTLEDKQGHKFTLKDVVHVPEADSSLISFMLAREQGLFTEFTSVHDFILNTPASGLQLPGTSINHILHVKDFGIPPNPALRSLAAITRSQTGIQKPASSMSKTPESDQQAPAYLSSGQSKRRKMPRKTTPPSLILPQLKSPAIRNPSDAHLWHLRLGHASLRSIQKIPSFQFPDEELDCEPCILAKAHKNPFPRRDPSSNATTKLYCIHSDLCEALVPSLDKSLYYITFIDECTRYCWVYPVQNKKASTIKDVFLRWKAEAETFSGTKVKFLRTDGGGEYEKEVKTFLHATGVVHEPTPAYTHESNDIAERINRTLNESARAMLIQVNMPQSFWAEAIITAAQIKNILPHSFFNDPISPYERWHDEPPLFLEHLRPFGCTVYALIPKERRPPRSKFLARATKGCLIKYIAKGIYRYYDFVRKCFNTSHDLHVKKHRFPSLYDYLYPSRRNTVIILSSRTHSHRHAHFHSRSPSSSPDLDPPIAGTLTPKPPTIPPKPIFDCITVEPPPKLIALFASTDPTYELQTFHDAITCLDAKHWIAAMKDEIQSMLDNHAFTLCDLLSNRKCISCKWIYKIKKDANNQFKRFRARLVAQGYSQVFHLDFEKTYAPVVRIDSVRLIFAIVAYFGLHLLHADAKTAFINGHSDIDLYLRQISGFIDEHYPNKVLRLNRSLYSTKQACRIWYLLLCKTIIEYGFYQLKSDECIFISPEQRTIILVYVDDVLIIATQPQQCQDIYNYLAQHFRMNNLGSPTNFLGINIIRNQNIIPINQSGYIDRMLQRFQMRPRLRFEFFFSEAFLQGDLHRW